MKKKFLSLTVALGLLVGSAAALPRNAFNDSDIVSASGEKTYKGFEYVVSEDGSGYSLSDYVGESGDITLPTKIEGKTVGTIVFGGFGRNTKITGLTVPGTFKELSPLSFSECPNLKEVELLNGVEKLGYLSFYNCTSLKTVKLPDSIEFSPMTFGQCSSFTEFVVNDTNKNYTTSKGDGALYSKDEKTLLRCPAGKTSFTVPATVENIGYCAFWGCTKLEKLELPSSLRTIEASAFSTCQSLTEIVIPEGVKKLESNIFSVCPKLKSVTLPSSLEEIDEDGLFGHGTPVKDITIYCQKDSYAEQYAKKAKINYKIVPKNERLAGTNRFGTAAEIAKMAFPDGAETVVLANGLTFADALAGVPLASKLNAPILLANVKSLPKETTNAIEFLGAKNVIILGGEGVISNEVEKTLTDNKLTVKRLAGEKRFGTATAIAAELNEAPEEIFFVYAFNSADALSVGGVAAAKNAPIIYLTTKGKLNEDTAAYLEKVKGKVKKAYVIGGEGVIDKDMMKQAGDALGLTAGKTITRVAGANRYGTCVEVNNTFKDVLTGEGICVAKGLDFPDALAGGVYAAKTKQALFLADGNKIQDIQAEYLKGKKAASLTVFGGTGAVSDNLVKVIAEACGLN